MKVMNKGVERDIKILTHFKFDTDADYNTEYVLYTDSEHEGVNLYLASVFYDNEKINFIMPDREKFEDLKKIIENLISNNPNNFIFSQRKYKYIDSNIFETKEIEEVEVQRVQLTQDQYKNILNNKYLSYPFSNMLKKDSVKNMEYSKNKNIYIIIASIFLVIFFGSLMLFESDLSKNLFDFDKVGMIIATFQFDSVADYYGITSSVIFQLGLVTLVLALFSYYYEDSKPVMFYILSYLFLFVFSILFYSHMKAIDLAHLGDYNNTIKGLAMFAVVNALIVTITYQAFKGITVAITDVLKVKNFVVHYAIFLILFMIGTIGLMLFYDYNMYEHVAKFVTDIVYGG